jgi:hypothetical protein
LSQLLHSRVTNTLEYFMKHQPITTACQLCSGIMIVSVSQSDSNILKSLGRCTLTKKEDVAVRFQNKECCVWRTAVNIDCFVWR